MGWFFRISRSDLSLSDTQLRLSYRNRIRSILFCDEYPIARWADRGNGVTVICDNHDVVGHHGNPMWFDGKFGQFLLSRIGVAVAERDVFLRRYR